MAEEEKEVYENQDSEPETEVEVSEAKYKKKRNSGKKFMAILTIIVAVIIASVGIVIHQSNELQKTFYQVKSDKVINNIRVVCLSDMHLKEFGKDNEELVEMVGNLGPDIVAIVGDMNMESDPDNYDCVINICKKLDEIAPVYYSLGNHEIDAMLFEGSKIYKDIKAEGINIFNNESATVNVNGTEIDIIGLTQGPENYDQYGRAFFEKALDSTDNFKLVLTHYPELFQGYLEDYEIDLALTGHAHGGLVRLPWIGGLYAADQGIFPELCDGYHEISNSKVIITRGLGKSGVVPRINNRPEVAVIDIGWY